MRFILLRVEVTASRVEGLGFTVPRGICPPMAARTSTS